MAYDRQSPFSATELVPLKDPAFKDVYGDPLYTRIDENSQQHLLKTTGQNVQRNVISKQQLKDTSETAYNAGNISGAVALDYANGHYQYATATGNITSLTISNLPPSGQTGFLTLEIKQDATGGRTITLTGYRTAGGDGIALTTAANAVDKLRFETRDGGTTIDAYANLNMLV